MDSSLSLQLPPSSSSSSHILLLEDLPVDINIDEIKSFLNGINIIENGIKIVRSSGTTTLYDKLNLSKAFVEVQQQQNIYETIRKFDRTYLTNRIGTSSNLLPIHVSLSNHKQMNKELKRISISKVKTNLTLNCEWEDCGLKFNDRTLYLSHINSTHVKTYNPDSKCQWQGCYENSPFVNIQHFQLHLSFHAFHNQLMNIGQQVMDNTHPKPICYSDGSARNLLTELTQIMICGWKGCEAEFHDVETFFEHVDRHAIEDVSIPMMSKEKLKKVRFAKCQWIKCQATFKKKSHLKVHLSSHTSKKSIACPVCGSLFVKLSGFLAHCYRQETSVSVEPMPIQDYVVDDDESEGILTIDEDANPSSIVIHLPGNILPSQATIINHDHQDNSSSKTESNVALLVNFQTNQNENQCNMNDNETSTNGDNVIQLELAPAPSNHHHNHNNPHNPHHHHSHNQLANIRRKYCCTLCPKSFDMSDMLREHMVHHKAKYKCPHCPYSAGYKSRLDEHILFKHTDNYEFKCSHCDQSFKKRRFLRRHIELHRNDKNIICHICEQTFTTYYSFNRHVRVQHLKEQFIFKCHLCNKKYNRGNNLSRHLVKRHQLKIAKGWSRFTYDKQQDGIFRINPKSCTINDDNHNDNCTVSTSTTTTTINMTEATTTSTAIVNTSSSL